MGWDWGKAGTAFNVLADPMGILGVSDNNVTNMFGKDKDKAIKPDPNLGYLGGDPNASKAYLDQYQGGIASGKGQTQMGIDRMNSAGGMGIGLRNQGLASTNLGTETFRGGVGLAGNGIGLANKDRGIQLEAANMQRGAALGLAPSQAQQLMRANSDQLARQQMAQASSARGGNQAAAMAAAQAGASQQSLAMGQQLAALRAQEMAQARGAYGEIGGQIRGQDLQQSAAGAQIAGLGGQMTGLGYNAQNQGIGALQTSGANIANIGQAREATYLGSLNDQLSGERDARIDLEMARLGQARADREAKQKRQGALLGMAGTVVGGMYGGPAGGAAGGAAGQGLGA